MYKKLKCNLCDKNIILYIKNEEDVYDDNVKLICKYCKKEQNIKNDFIFYENGSWCEIILKDKQGYESMRAKIDIIDFDKVKNIKWCASEDKTIKGFYVRGGDGKIQLHNVIMRPSRDMVVDHINHNPLNNRRSNLRKCTLSQNQYNRKICSLNRSGYTGVSFFSRDKKWRAKITVNKKIIGLGYFKNKQDAVTARKKAELKYFKEFIYKGEK